MPFPIEPDPRHSEPESDFLIQDPFGLRKAITPFFAFDLQDGMLANPANGASEGLGTSFYVTPFGHQLSAMHLTTDFLNARKASIRPGPEKNILELKGTWIGVTHDPGLVFGMAKAGEVLVANDFALFPVDQSKHPLAITFTSDRLNYVEPSLDLTGWNICGLGDRKTVYLPIRVGCPASIAEGDRVLAVGYPSVKTWRQHPDAQMVTYREEMRGSIGRVLKVDRTWDQDRKIWPTITVDADWKGGMSGGPVFNENGDVVGIVSRGVDSGDESQPWSSALWLEPLPFREDIYGSIDPRYPGRIVGWGACNAHSAIELFQTREAAEDYVRNAGSPLNVQKTSISYRTLFTRPDNFGPGRRMP
jgi:serine protease Do